MKTVLHHYLLLSLLLLAQVAFGQDNDTGLNIANTQIEQLAEEKNYSPKDIEGTIISDDYVSGGIRHIYYQQTINNIGVYGTSGAVHLKDDQIIASNLNFLPQADKRNIQSEFQVQALEALARLAIDQGYPLSQTEIIVLAADEAAPDKNTLIQADGISNRVIPLKLVYFVNQTEEVQLAWNLFIDEVDGAEYKNYMVSAKTGTILFEENLTLTCTFDHDHSHDHTPTPLHRPITGHSLENINQTDSLYNVLPYTIESPNFGARSILANPWENPTASPDGWHHILGLDHQYTIGNNVDAYADRDNTNAPTGGNDARAFGGADLVFDYPWDPNGTQTDYTKAATTNLFYMNNVAHDIFYNYGFDEASGNFQEDNFNKGGVGSDGVNAEAQDASGSCNAKMNTLADGSNPRMQMFLCSGRDGDYDNGVILHEYGHGISNRLTGGPQAIACLVNAEQMGEGWSDFFGMLLTMNASDVATTDRTIGTFLFNQDANGAGLRPYPYTTDMTVNPMTYKTIDDVGITQPHGVGAVWATMLWDLNWALINQYGWDADMYNGTGGNNIALRLVMEGLKIQPCSPGFIDGRDAILVADDALYNGVNRCLIWEVFARRGLGYSADQGSSSSRTDGAEGYDMPPECTVELKHTVDKTNAFLGERLTFQLEAINHLDAIVSNVIITDTLPDNVQFYSASHGGMLNGSIVEWPAFNLSVGETKTFELKVTVNDAINFDADFLDDLESGGEQWKMVQVSGTHTWDLQSQYYYSPSNGWFITNANSTTETHLVLKDALALTDSSELTFNHFFDLETSYDFGLVEISTDGGENWASLEGDFTQNGYNNATQFGYNAYSSMSADIIPNTVGFITSKADLSTYAGQVAIIRFRLLTDINTSKFGWIVDDIGISNTNYALPNFGNIRNSEYNFDTQVKTPVTINQTMINHTVETAADTLITFENAAAMFADVQANDIDADGVLDTLITTIIQAATNGTAMVINDDSISYVPTANFLGRDTIVYQVCDEANACETDTLFIFVEIAKLAPLTNPDFITVNQNSSNHFLNVQGNDSDPNGVGDTLVTSILKDPSNGTAIVIHNDSVNYSPTTDYFGLDTIVYQVCDTTNLCSSDTIFITIIDINEAPVATADYLIINENTTNNTINVQGNDNDPDGIGDSLLTTILEMSLHGAASVSNEDSISYTPSMNYSGLDTIVYQVCDTANLCATDTIFITIIDINEAPTAVTDSLIIDKNTNDNTINVQANDSDPDGSGDTLITSIVEMPAHGTATVIDDDSISYTPTTTYFGLDTIVYQICDTANLCAIDTIFITINDFNEAPITSPDFLVIEENTINNYVVVQANDNDPNGIGDTLVTILVKSATNGATVVVNEDSILFTPIANFVGLDTIVYQVCDTSNLCTIDTLFITVTMMNLAPEAVVDIDTINKNSQHVYFDVQANDRDPNGIKDLLTTSILSGALHGVVGVIDGDSLVYTPTTDYFGGDTVVYQICDLAGLCDSDTLFITIRDILFCSSENLVKNEDGVLTGNYVASNEINSAGIINNGTEVKFVAGKSITLLPGFHAGAGADFTAMINQCESVVADADLIEEIPTITKDRETTPPGIEGNSLLVRPNPFRNTAIVDYELAKDSPIWIGLHDLTGKVLHVFVNQGEQMAGSHQYQLSAAQLPSGAYWIAMRTPDMVLTKKIIILR